ncbi:MAG: ketopantoate reductase family protein, partial [Hyphomicrobiales bacterium]
GLTLASVDPGGWIANALADYPALGCVVYCAAEMAAPGIVRHGPRARFVLGDPGGTHTQALRAASDLLAVPGTTAPIARDIRHDVWMKLWGNAVINPVSALTLAKVGRSVSAPESTATVAALFEEVKRVFEALGIRTDVPVDRRIAEAARLTTHRSSMLQDLEAGRTMEIEAITGAVVELAHILNVEVPRLETVLSLIRLRATATT